MSSKKKKDRLKHFCPVQDCELVFARPSKLEVHLRKHTGKRPFECDKFNCGKTYASYSHLKRHIMTFHANVKSTGIKCPHKECPQRLANSCTLRKHIERIHSNERTWAYKCNNCDKGFKTENRLIEHDYVHTGIIPFECDKCKLKYTSARIYKKHLQNHRIYMCKCGEEFEKYNRLRTHRKTCIEFTPICEICKKVFASNKNVKEHYLVHEEAKDLYQCPVEDCDRFYFYKKNMDYHIKSFHLKQPKLNFPCSVEDCKKILSSKASLRNHIKLHSRKPSEIEKERSIRKDKGSYKKSTALTLAGLQVAHEAEKSIIADEDVDLLITDEDSDCSIMEEEMEENISEG